MLLQHGRRRYIPIATISRSQSATPGTASAGCGAAVVSSNRRGFALGIRFIGGASPNGRRHVCGGAAAADLPAHLGWESRAATAVARRPPILSEVESVAGRQQTTGTSVMPPLPAQDKPQLLAGVGTAPIVTEPAPDWVKLYPDIGLGMLRQELAAPGRLWLLLRHMDGEGRGVLRIDNLVNTLTKPSCSLYLCGKRQLRNSLPFRSEKSTKSNFAEKKC